MTIHRQRGGRYWYYWLLLIGGTIFVIAALATDMFSLAGTLSVPAAACKAGAARRKSFSLGGY